MKKSMKLTAGIAALFLGVSIPQANAGVDLNINVGQPAPVYIVPARPQPVMVVPAPPPPPRERFIIREEPRFIFTPALGFYVSVDAPYDIVQLDGVYYIQNEGRWYRSSNYRGPWVYVEQRRIPGRLRRHEYSDIRRFRDEEYRRHGHEERFRDRDDRGRGHDNGPDRDNGRGR
jgi:hypothetical protein